MNKQPLNPPPVIDQARVLSYAILDDSVKFSGHTSLYVDGKELGRVPCLAICEERNSSDVLLFHCAADWATLGCAAYGSVAEAKQRAEGTYPGVSKRWVDANISKDAAESYLARQWKGQECSFCGKRPDQVVQMYSSSTARICDACLRTLSQQLPHRE